MLPWSPLKYTYNKNNYNRNGGFLLSQAWSFNKHVNRRKTGPSKQVGPLGAFVSPTVTGPAKFGQVYQDLDENVTLIQSPDDEDRDGPRNFDLLGV